MSWIACLLALLGCSSACQYGLESKGTASTVKEKVKQWQGDKASFGYSIKKLNNGEAIDWGTFDSICQAELQSLLAEAKDQT